MKPYSGLEGGRPHTASISKKPEAKLCSKVRLDIRSSPRREFVRFCEILSQTMTFSSSSFCSLPLSGSFPGTIRGWSYQSSTTSPITYVTTSGGQPKVRSPIERKERAREREREIKAQVEERAGRDRMSKLDSEETQTLPRLWGSN